MRIDLLTVAAQMVNFLILLWLLRRFLYGPVMEAMRGREQRIAESLQDAHRLKRDAEQEGQGFRERSRDLDDRREELLANARAEAQQERAERLEEVHTEAEEKQRQWYRQLEAEQAEFLSQLRLRSLEYTATLARRALRDLGDASLEDQIARVFARRLEELDHDEREQLAQACRNDGLRMTLRTRFEMEPAARRLIARAIQESVLDGAEVSFEHDAAFACGVELSAGGQTVQWSFESYLDDLHHRMSEELDKSLARASGGSRP